MKEKFINFALNEVGYKEGINNDNKYGNYFGMNHEPWCCFFVSYCARMCNIPENIIPNYAECGQGYNYFKNKNEIFNYAEPGDIVFFKPTIPGAISSHTGIVVDVKDDYVITVEGNASSNTDGVYKLTYKENYTNFLGFARPDYNDKVNVLYQAYDNKYKRWLNIIENYNNVNEYGYAGNFKHTIGGIRVKLSNNDTIYIKSHIKNYGWLNDIHEWNDSLYGYSGILGKSIDAVMIKSTTKVAYRVHLMSGRWLNWITGYDINDPIKGYAGILGEAIDAIQIKVL